MSASSISGKALWRGCAASTQPTGDETGTGRYWLVLCTTALLAFGTTQRAYGASEGHDAAAPRAITPRGELAPEERTTIELFERSRDSVVFISTKEAVVDLWSRNVMAVPRGTGSGFIWDEAGHVVTNYHVIHGASEASIKLVDGRSFRAVLVGASPEHDIAVLKSSIGP